MKINAVAGSGKTTTMIEYARERPANSRILYLAFNKSVKVEASKKFLSHGIQNVQVDTAHSLAYRPIVLGNKYTVRPQGYKTHEIADILKLKGTGEKHTEYMVANHIHRFVSYFCNSDKNKVQELNYLDVVTDDTARQFVASHYDYILKQTRIFLSKMNKGEIEITHDFYLKKFQLSHPQLSYDYILFDEGQDASGAMLDIFLKQNAIKVIVGDTHQQIYGWRFAVNSLEKVDFDTYLLSNSFRFQHDIAELATDVLEWKRYLNNPSVIPINGKGKSQLANTEAVIGRTNLGLLLKAIEFVVDERRVKHIYFEGNIHSYTYADEGASLYDVLNLYNGKKQRIRDKLIRQMKDMDELEEYITNADDVQLSMMVEMVKEYENELPGLIKSLKDKHVAKDEKERAEMIFSTVHKCKGMEYDRVHLVEDFITEEKLKKAKVEANPKEINASRLNEEINLLYVALTRTKDKLFIPYTLLPLGKIYGSPRIQISDADFIPQKEPYTKQSQTNRRNASPSPEKTYPAAKAGTNHKAAYKPWSPSLDNELTNMYEEDMSMKDIARHFGRSVGAVRARIKKLEL